MIKKFKKIFLIAGFASLLCVSVPAYATTPAGNTISTPNVSAESAIMIDAETGIVLYQKNADEQLYPASTTKIMTALLMLEHVKSAANYEPSLIPDDPLASPSFDTRIIFSVNAVYGIEPGSSHIAMDIDETLSLREALYAIMLPSANEVSVAIAEYISGTEEEFAQLMTRRAKELGCANTNFKNPHGLTHTEHYTSSRDLALILREAVTHPEFIQAISTRKYTIPPTEKQKNVREILNTNKLIQTGEFFYEYAVGGKTGYTDEARHTLVAYGVKDGVGVITAVMKCEKNFTYKDTVALMDYGFSGYETVVLLEKGGYFNDFDIPSQNGGSVPVSTVVLDGFSLLLPKLTDLSKIEKKPILDRSVTLPVKKGDVLGVLQLYSSNNYLGSVELVSTQDIADNAPAVTKAAEQPTAPPKKESATEQASAQLYNDNNEAVPVSLSNNPPPSTEKNGGNIWGYVIITVVAAAVIGGVMVARVFLSAKRNARRSRYFMDKRLFK